MIHGVRIAARNAIVAMALRVTKGQESVGARWDTKAAAVQNVFTDLSYALR